MRVPLKAMRDVIFPEKALPEKDAGYLDLEKAAALLPGAATLWLSDFIDLYEGDSKLLEASNPGHAHIAGIR